MRHLQLVATCEPQMAIELNHRLRTALGPGMFSSLMDRPAQFRRTFAGACHLRRPTDLTLLARFGGVSARCQPKTVSRLILALGG